MTESEVSVESIPNIIYVPTQEPGVEVSKNRNSPPG